MDLLDHGAAWARRRRTASSSSSTRARSSALSYARDAYDEEEEEEEEEALDADDCFRGRGGVKGVTTGANASARTTALRGLSAPLTWDILALYLCGTRCTMRVSTRANGGRHACDKSAARVWCTVGHAQEAGGADAGRA